MNTYLIVSDTIYFIEKTLKTLKSNIANVITFNMDVNTIDEVLEEASYLSMFDDEKCIIVKNAKFFGSSKNSDTKKSKEESDKLLKYLSNENKKVKLIFIINGKADSKKKIYNILSNAKNIYESKSMTKTEMKEELSKIVKENKYQIDDRSLWYIINESLGNFDLCVNEINKLFIYYSKPGNINYTDVLALTSKTIEENNFKLIDSIIAKNLDDAFSYLKEAQILKVEPSVIIALLYREFKLMLSVLLYEENKTPVTEILRELKLAEWQYQKVKNNLRMYNKREIKEQIEVLGDLDYQYKSGLRNKDTILITYILSLGL